VPAKLLIKFTSLSVSSPRRVFIASFSGSFKQTQPYKDDINYISSIISYLKGQPATLHYCTYCLRCMLTGVKNNGKSVWDI